MYNFIIVISLIIFIFFISADKKVTKNIIQKNSLHIIFFLLLIYFVYNNVHLGFLLLIILGLVFYYTNLKNFFYNYINKPSNMDSLDMWRDIFKNFNWSDIVNNHKSKPTSNLIESNQYLTEYNEEKDSKVDNEKNSLDNLMEEIDEELSA